jgi:cobalt/nickel transport system permease protein
LAAWWPGGGAPELRHLILDEWSRGRSGLHRRDPRAKIAAALILLIAVATASRGVGILGAILVLTLFLALLWARIPIGAVLLRATVVFSFTIPFALMSWLTGDSERAGALLVKSYLSAMAVLTLVATTPVAMLLRGLETAGAPRFLLMVAQFIYRYLFVIAEEAQLMRAAALARGATGAGFRPAAGAVGALFARSYARAEEIQRAMLARGFSGRFPALGELRFTQADAALVSVATGVAVAARVAAERLAG